MIEIPEASTRASTGPGSPSSYRTLTRQYSRKSLVGLVQAVKACKLRADQLCPFSHKFDSILLGKQRPVHKLTSHNMKFQVKQIYSFSKWCRHRCLNPITILFALPLLPPHQTTHSILSYYRSSTPNQEVQPEWLALDAEGLQQLFMLPARVTSAGSCFSWRSLLIAFRSPWSTLAPVAALIISLSWLVRGTGSMQIACRVCMAGAGDTVKGGETRCTTRRFSYEA
jgi:hypothetical protein